MNGKTILFYVTGVLAVLGFMAGARAESGYQSAVSRVEEAEKWVAIDLGKPVKIDAVVLSPIQGAGLFPVRFRIDVSDSPQFRTFTTVVDRLREDHAQATGAVRYEFAPTTGRSVRLVVTKLPHESGGRFAFGLSRIVVETLRQEVSTGAPVRASDALDSDSWSAAALTEDRAGARRPTSAPTTLPAQTPSILLDPRLALIGEFECSNAEINRIMRLASIHREPSPHAVALGIEACIAPWLLYQRTGDREVLVRAFPAAMRHVNTLRMENPDLLCKMPAIVDPDGAMPDGLITPPAPLPAAFVATAYFAHSARLTSRMAAVLGQKEPAGKYAALAGQIETVFNREFVRPDAGLVPNVPGAYALALHFELLPANLRPGAADRLAELVQKQRNHLATGTLSTGPVLLSLSGHGFYDVAIETALEQSPPTLARHPAVAETREWVWHCIAGIEPDPATPGMRRFIIKPRPAAGVQWASGRLETPQGAVSVAWKKERESFWAQITIPAGASAMVHIPAQNPESVIKRAGRFVQMRDGAAVFEVEAGDFRFESRS